MKVREMAVLVHIEVVVAFFGGEHTKLVLSRSLYFFVFVIFLNRGIPVRKQKETSCMAKRLRRLNRNLINIMATVILQLEQFISGLRIFGMI
ncbi:hypothetical protein HHI36_010977, partial [Cryptolaemus montrouzieri]